ncbi:MAG: PepSY domain-containing protein [Acinetobacter sp.]|nr:PepSY domain-containing protein [Acinetobacter sp.]
MFKKILFQIHWFLGITAGLILSIIGVTGAIYSYEQQIIKWINPDSYVVQAENRPKLTPEQLYTHFSTTKPELKINSVSLSSNPTSASAVNIEKEGYRRGYNMMVNPYTAELLPEVKGEQFFAAVQSLHRWLTVGKIGNREIGKQITGAATLMLIFFVLSGLFLRFPKKHSFRQWFAIKRELNGRNFLWDLHAVVGTWVAIFYLILAVTGLYWSYDWWRNGLFTVMGVENPAKVEKKADDKAAKPAPLSTTEVAQAFAFTWQNATAQMGREYSSITFNVPKKAGEIELTYVDAPKPQHERARNTVKFNYQDNKITKHDIYVNKPLNEKIMSSMLPVHRGSFFGGVYQFFAMLASLAMPLFFITGWMLYLKRRKQKQLTQQAKLAATASNSNATGDQWLIVYATQSGTAEQLAWQTSSSLQNAGHRTQVMAIQDISIDDLMQQRSVLMIASTFGTGEAPDLASNFAFNEMSEQADLSHLNFAVLALGSKEYADTFCLFGNQLAAWLEYCGATPLFDIIEVDNGNPADIQRWNAALAQVSNTELADIQLNKDFHSWTLVQRDVLNPNTVGQLAFNIELENHDNLTWQAGDIAEIQPANSDERIAQFIANTSFQADETLLDGTPWSVALRYKNLMDTSAQNINGATPDEVLEQLNDLPTREYSIANIPTQNNATQRLRLVVRQHKDQNQELGLGSGWLTALCPMQHAVDVHIRSNASFHLIDDERPIICIGNGTGIAGLMSLLHARAARQHHDNWLIWGERQQAHDYFYREQLQAWLNAGVLQHLDVTFSRDQAEKIYVQHKIRENAAQIQAWIERGAVIYVCGSIDGMASDVDQALCDILGHIKVDELRQQQRYKRDVY